MVQGDTIAAIATAPGRGGVAVIRVSGPEALAIAERLTRTGQTGQKTKDKGQSVRKLYSPSVLCPSTSNLQPSTSNLQPSSLIDEALVLVFRAPHSYTGEDVVEFQCHGGAVTPRRVLEACLAVGARLARRGEFTERAFLNGRLDYDQAEAVLDLVNARTDRAADAALDGLTGSKSRAYRALYETALDLSTRVEHALDVDEGELPVGFTDDIASRVSNLVSEISAALRRANEGKLLREGAMVVLAGPPNAGKSSLMNALLEEQRAIVSEIPGTTRDTIEEGLNLDGWPIRLVDTAGLRSTDDAIEAEGVKRSEALMARADVVLWLGNEEEVEKRGGGGQRSENHPSSFVFRPSTCLRVHAKCDLGHGDGLNVSAKTGEGMEALKREIVAALERRLTSPDAEGDANAERLSALQDARTVLSSLVSSPFAFDLVLVGNALRQASERLGSLVGAVYSADFLDNLFSRFCVGK